MAKTDDIKWHPGFCSAIELELREYRDGLTFERERQLNKEPTRIDFLVIKKDPGLVIDNEIAEIFRKHNLLEFKSPRDELGIDEYSRAMAYAKPQMT